MLDIEGRESRSIWRLFFVVIVPAYFCFFSLYFSINNSISLLRFVLFLGAPGTLRQQKQRPAFLFIWFQGNSPNRILWISPTAYMVGHSYMLLRLSLSLFLFHAFICVCHAISHLTIIRVIAKARFFITHVQCKTDSSTWHELRLLWGGHPFSHTQPHNILLQRLSQPQQFCFLVS